MSLNPGVQQYCETTTGIHVTKPDGIAKAQQPVKSWHEDAATPVEYGATAAKRHTATVLAIVPSFLIEISAPEADTTSGVREPILSES